MKVRDPVRSEALDHIDRKMALAFGALITLLMAVFFTVVAYQFAKIRREEHVQLSSTIASMVRESVSSISFAGKHHLRGFITRLVEDNDNIAFIHVTDKSGTLIAGSGVDAEHVHDLNEQQKLLRSERQNTRTIIWKNEPTLEISIPASTGFLEVPHVIRVGVHHAIHRKALLYSFLPIVMLWLLLLLFALPAVRAIATRIGAPVKAVARIFAGLMDHAPLFIVVGNKKEILSESTLSKRRIRGVSRKQNMQLLFDDDKGPTTTESFLLEMPLEKTPSTIQGVRFDVGLDDNRCFIGLDITEEASLRAQTSQLAFAMENAAEQMWTSSPDGKIEWANQAAINTLGVPLIELGKKHFLDLFSVDNEPSALAALVAALKNTEPYVGQLAIACDSGKLVRCEIRCSHFLGEGQKEKSVLWVVRDVTRELRLEEELRQSQKMESIGKLAGGIAHDFNNLLTVINGVAAMELQMGGLDEEREESFQSILQAGERAADLTSQMLTFSRQQVQRLVPLQMALVVEEMMPMLERLVPESLQISISAQEDLPRVLADRGQLDQVLLNLVINARDAMSGKGHIQIHTFCKGPTAQTPQDPDAPHAKWVYLEVSDEGGGIPQDVLPRIFDPFFTTKEVGEGTGLGLSTVFGIAEQSGGTLWAENLDEGGARFTFALPITLLESESESETEEDLSFANARGQGVVFLVENKSSVRENTARLLLQKGFDVEIAACGEDALRFVKDENLKYDLLISDVKMPNMTGPELATELKKLGRITPIVWMSENPTKNWVDEDWQSMAVVVQKPVRPRKLMAAVFKVAPERISFTKV